MSNVLIINAHHHYPFAEGRLNKSLTQLADELITGKGHNTRIVTIDEGWDVQQELENHQWADIILLQSPVNWMMPPWTFKKYMDEVYTAGMGGALCNGDGRHQDAPKENYGAGGTLQGKKYMLSLTFNAPAESFDDESEYLFQGKSADDLFFPMHMNFRFFAMESLPTFACFDVMKNAEVEKDFERFKQHIDENF
ncbi:NAD(P)H-dependent oxidoreductase [Marinobacterium sp. AK62]|uniref:NAD(P)H-dependent oxidoreductase n=1 Tax=Marinobacterium alkalitolerans TaxID=1542925 RepID=A0ABS3ZDU1_9GAMM|nr:NAD(P)H-dependent oxidoreductase [Marinobacterium alkalitolerans]MBP0049867.1 NAD(P)H-dependent oxidoreductase [Marinobacterium alkalitolerans]